MDVKRAHVVVSFMLFIAFALAQLPAMAPLAYAQSWKPAEDPGGETPTGSGTTYYVSSSQGNDSKDGRSRTTPWRTLAKVTQTAFKPGDTILFKRGDVWANQVLKFTSSGQSGKPITYGAYGTGNRPVIKGGANISMKRQTWIELDRLHFHKGQSLRIETSTHVTFQNSEISHMYRVCLRIRKESQHVLIKQNKIHDCGVRSGGMTKQESGVNGEGIYLGTAAGKGIVDRTGFVTIQANEIYNTTDEGINIKENTHNVLIENNVVHDLTTSDPGGINLGNVIGENHTVRGNIVYNIRGHDNAGSRIGTGIVTGKGTNVYNNLVYNNQHFGIRAMSQSKVYHNTIYGNSSGAVERSGNDADVRNNIGPELSGNIRAQNNLFVNALGGDFNLRGGSLAIGTCTNVGIDNDIVGTKRSQGSGVDYGAYETVKKQPSFSPKNLRLLSSNQ